MLTNPKKVTRILTGLGMINMAEIPNSAIKAQSVSVCFIFNGTQHLVQSHNITTWA